MSQPLPPETSPLPYSVPYRVAGLSSRKPNRFDLKPDAETRAAIAAFLDITAITALRFTGVIAPKGRHDFVLEAELEAKVEQPCCVSLAPVHSHLREDVLRVFLADYDMPEAAEMEMPEDDTSEPLGEVIDAGHVLLEALALALPPFPKAEGAALESAQFTAPGTAALRDEDLRPFAGLAALKAKLESPDDDAQGNGS